MTEFSDLEAMMETMMMVAFAGGLFQVLVRIGVGLALVYLANKTVKPEQDKRRLLFYLMGLLFVLGGLWSAVQLTMLNI